MITRSSLSKSFFSGTNLITRLGNLFAITVAFFLKIAVANAYWQCLGLKLKQQHVSLGALDDAFGVLGNMFSLVNKELFSKLRLATSLALVLW